MDTRNNADSAVYQAEKMLKDDGDKFDPADRSDIEQAIGRLKDSISSGNLEDMKTDTEALQQAIYKASENLYKKAQQEQAGGPDTQNYQGGSTEGGTYEADFKDAGADPQ